MSNSEKPELIEIFDWLECTIKVMQIACLTLLGIYLLARLPNINTLIKYANCFGFVGKIVSSVSEINMLRNV